MISYENIGFHMVFTTFFDTIWLITAIFAYILVYISDFGHFPDGHETIRNCPDSTYFGQPD